MSKQQHMTVGRRLALGFGLLLAIMAAVAGLAAWGLGRAESALIAVYEDRTVPLEKLAGVRFLATRDRLILMDALIASQPEVVAKRSKEFAANREASDARWKAYRAANHSAAELQLAATTEAALDAFVSQGLRPMNEALRAGRYDDAKAILNSKVSPLNPVFSDAIGELLKLQVQSAAADHAEQQTNSRKVNLTLFGLCAAGLLLGVGAAVVITRTLVRQLGAEPEALAQLAAEVAHGNLSDDGIAPALPGSVMASMQEMRQGLVKVVGGVRSGVDSVATASAQIAQGNAELSSRTEQQAASLEETAASMEELTGTVRNASENARQANQLALSASTAASRGGEEVAQLVQTMSDIQAASSRIAEITGVIDSIAFQTNILALNAAVEAARAGEQGRGFAVVATEVRALAQRSAEAARQIKSLIADSSVKVEAGGARVSKAGDTMTEVVRQVQSVSALITAISHAASEQSQGIQQVGEAVTQLDQTTQQNAALVEQSAAAAESLKTQADQLSRSVAVFRLTAAWT